MKRPYQRNKSKILSKQLPSKILDSFVPGESRDIPAAQATETRKGAHRGSVRAHLKPTEPKREIKREK